ncbi:hypothetical protein PtA15_6A67 [Puccinia triticina]|uniref:Pre-rRNA-processing protein RIX1 n=1 Tax=Puccinia triticina TaxID=208348 RepID=A0ABY7CJN0_9BASI|nr:uncharacterized protein PtA15_6A67 [Puccinia triticina]WAQ85439.1 hypothetical protein PtA15_6A67 [Puccinia triticina]
MHADLARLQAIFAQPESVAGLEKFTEIVYRPSPTMLATLLTLFAQAGQQQQPATASQLHANPLFILLLIKRILTFADPIAPHQPPRNTLSHHFHQLFLPIFTEHLHQSNSPAITRNFTICIAKLASRLLPLSFQANSSTGDPLAALLLHDPLQHPAHLVAVRDIVTKLQKSNSINSAYLLHQVTQKHLQSLLLVYQHLTTAIQDIWTGSADQRVAEEEKQQKYARGHASLHVLLKILRTVVPSLVELGQQAVFAQYTPALLADFQAALDIQLAQPLPLSRALPAYGTLFLLLQPHLPPEISDQLLATYLKILKLAAHSLIPASSPDHRLLCALHPILVQALKLLNSAANPWNCYCVPGTDPTSSTRSLLDGLGAEEAARLVTIVQPFVALDLRAIVGEGDEPVWHPSSSSSSEDEDDDGKVYEDGEDGEDEEEGDGSGEDTQSLEMEIEVEELNTPAGGQSINLPLSEGDDHLSWPDPHTAPALLAEKARSLVYLDQPHSAPPAATPAFGHQWHRLPPSDACRARKKDLLQREAKALLAALKASIPDA